MTAVPLSYVGVPDVPPGMTLRDYRRARVAPPRPRRSTATALWRVPRALALRAARR